MMTRMFGCRWPVPAPGPAPVPGPGAWAGVVGRCGAWACAIDVPPAAVAIKALPPSRTSRREFLLAIVVSLCAGQVTSIAVGFSGADIAHAEVHRLHVAGRRALRRKQAGSLHSPQATGEYGHCG